MNVSKIIKSAIDSARIMKEGAQVVEEFIFFKKSAVKPRKKAAYTKIPRNPEMEIFVEDAEIISEEESSYLEEVERISDKDQAEKSSSDTFRNIRHDSNPFTGKAGSARELSEAYDSDSLAGRRVMIYKSAASVTPKGQLLDFKS